MITFGHRSSGPDKEAFHRYLSDFGAVENEQQLLRSLRGCADVMPSQYARLLFLTPGLATYRDAVRLLLSRWRSTPGSTDDFFGA